MENNDLKNHLQIQSSGTTDIVKMALKEAILDTTVTNDILMSFMSILERYNVSTFLVRKNITRIVSELIKPDGYQDALFDFFVEYRYRLLSYGLDDESISSIVDTSISIIVKSIIATDDYKSTLGLVDNEVKKDIFLCLLYLFRVNINYAADCLKIKIDKENRR